MLTKSEIKYFALSLFFLILGSGIKFYQKRQVHLGPFEDKSFAEGEALAYSSRSKNIDSTKFPRVESNSSSDSSELAIAEQLNPVSSSSNSSSAEEGYQTKMEHLPSESSKNHRSWASGKASEPHSSIHKGNFHGKVSINKAQDKDLMQIRGIGEKTAKIMVAYRKEHGPFKDLQDLLQVKGIGEKKLEKILPFLIL